jgi:hypothetical protein
MLLSLTIFIIVVAFAFLRIGHQEIINEKWHRRYVLRVLRISIPIAIVTASILWSTSHVHFDSYIAVILAVQILAVIGYVMTGWLTLIFSFALLISTIHAR